MTDTPKRGSTSLALKAGFWYVISTFLVKAISFFTTPIFARLMDETSYGEFSNFASWQSTLLIIAGAELYNTLSRAYYDHKEDYDRYVSSVTLTSCILTFAMYIVFILCGDWIYDIVSIPPQFVHIMFFTMTFQSCKQIFFARERTLYRYKTVAAISFANLIIPTVISVILVILAPNEQRLAARIYGFYLPWAVIGLGCMIVMLLRGRCFKLKHSIYALKLSLPLMVHYLTAYLLTSTNTIIAKNMLDAAAAAVVSIATSTIHIITILFQSVSGAVTTWLMDNLDQSKRNMVKKGTLIYTACLAVVSIGVILLAPEIVWILGGSKYASATLLIPGLVLAVLIQSVTSVFNIILTYDKNVVKTAVYTGIIAALSIVAKVYLTPMFGFNALPWINVAAFGILYFINYILIKKAGYADSVSMKGMTAVLLVTSAFVGISFILYKHILIRYGLIALIALVALFAAYKYRAVIIKLLKSRKKKKTSPAIEKAD